MNLAKVETKLYKVKVAELAALDQEGIHIGFDKPKGHRYDTVKFINYLYVIAINMNEVTGYLSKHGIDPIEIEKIDIILNARS